MFRECPRGVEPCPPEREGAVRRHRSRRGGRRRVPGDSPLPVNRCREMEWSGVCGVRAARRGARDALQDAVHDATAERWDKLAPETVASAPAKSSGSSAPIARPAGWAEVPSQLTVRGKGKWWLDMCKSHLLAHDSEWRNKPFYCVFMDDTAAELHSSFVLRRLNAVTRILTV